MISRRGRRVVHSGDGVRSGTLRRPRASSGGSIPKLMIRKAEFSGAVLQTEPGVVPALRGSARGCAGSAERDTDASL